MAINKENYIPLDERQEMGWEQHITVKTCMC